jgi:16S rRNA (guanine527-N7)-methyltransferase
MNKHEFEVEIKKIFKNINDNFFSLVDEYKLFLQEYNKKVNLTRLDTEEKIYKDYFYESVIPYKDLDFLKINSVLDIGSGSGIPGVVIKLLYPHIKLTIIESNNKKIAFLKELTKKLNITITLYADRAENIARQHNEQFDLVTSRAVAVLPAILEISIRYVKIGG